MKSNELRIGNYYLSFGVDLKQIERLTIGKVIIDFHPIKLNEDWLLQLGFHSFAFSGYEKFTDGGYSFRLTNEKRKSSHKLYFEFFDQKEIKYVHQLQNLYFGLTEEELVLRTPQ